jgi:hypothetical protein
MTVLPDDSFSIPYIKNRPLSDQLSNLGLGHCLNVSDFGPSIWKRAMNVATRHNVCIVNFWNNKNTFFHTNIMSDLDIRILGLLFLFYRVVTTRKKQMNV